MAGVYEGVEGVSKGGLNAEILRELVEYDPETGIFTWKKRDAKWFSDSIYRKKEAWCNAWNSKWSGSPAFTAIMALGYCKGSLLNKQYFAHRLAWMYVHGCWPDGQIDHINGVKSDNRIKNLRDVNNSENSCNKLIQSNNRTGYKGVSFNKKSGKWISRIEINGKIFCLGYFSCPEDAHEAYRKAADRLHGEYKNYG